MCINMDQYKCDLCGLFSTSERTLSYHMRSHNRDTPFQKEKRVIPLTQSHCDSKLLLDCDLCNLYAADADLLATHVKTHEEEKVVFKCDVCGVSTTNERSLSYHMRTHKNKTLVQNRVVCPENRLIKSLKQQQGCEPFKCDVCGKMFSNSVYLNQHKRCHQYGNDTVQEKIVFKCGVCGVSTTNKRSLQNHLNQHKRSHQYGNGSVQEESGVVVKKEFGASILGQGYTEVVPVFEPEFTEEPDGI